MKGGAEPEGFVWVEEHSAIGNAPPFPPPQTERKKRKYQHRKKVFVGWGSRELLRFLQSIGRDAAHQISRYDVAAIITAYVNENKLIHPAKKRRVLCDERLLSLFGRKTISRNKIYDLLGAHYAESEEEGGSGGSDGCLWSSDDDGAPFAAGKSQSSPSKRKTPLKRKVSEAKSCFAAIAPDNLKLVYLKRSLVELLLKDFGSFERKVVGSFVRVKSDPNDYLQKNSHLLVQVTGLKKGADTQVLLQVAGLFHDVSITMLSDENFNEEECEDLCQRVKDGLLKRPTLVEFEEKARILREDIMKHWFPRELALLQNLIERCNEKGWRRELAEYLERRQLLQTPDEQSRLLREIPPVIADEVEDDSAAKDVPENEGEIMASPRSILRGSSEGLTSSAILNTTVSTQITQRTDAAGYSNGVHIEDERKQPVVENQRNQERHFEEEKGFQGMEGRGSHATPLHIEDHEKQTTVEDSRKERRQVEKSRMEDRKVEGPEVIDLISDDEIEPPGNCQSQNLDYTKESLIWLYVDPQGKVQGPFSLEQLKWWRDSGYFAPDFKVWRVGESQSKCVILNEIL